MITDRTLIRISLAVAIIGIAALFILVSLTEPRHASIAEIKPGENVLVSGTVADYKESRGTIFFTFENISSVNVVMFLFPMVKLTDGDSVTVAGKVQYYRNEMEIVAKDIKLQ